MDIINAKYTIKYDIYNLLINIMYKFFIKDNCDPGLYPEDKSYDEIGFF